VPDQAAPQPVGRELVTDMSPECRVSRAGRTAPPMRRYRLTLQQQPKQQPKNTPLRSPMNDTATKMISMFQALWATRSRGATAVEYALLVSLIAIAVIAAVTFLGDKIGNSFDTTGTALGG
jgi:pilus assembly protein Flp/PilA